jgi:WD40 repeat protein
MIIRYSHTLVKFVFILSLSLIASVYAQSPLRVQEIWRYGHGVIHNFNWNQAELNLVTDKQIWEFDPTTASEPVISNQAVDDFRLSSSPKGAYFVTSKSGQLLLWNAKHNTVITTIQTGGYTEEDAVAWDPAEKLLATIGYDEASPEEQRYQVNLWSTATGERVKTVGGYSQLIVGLRWHPAGQMLALRFSDGKILIVDVSSGKQIKELASDPGNLATIDWSPDGNKLAASANSGSPIKVWKVPSFEPVSLNNEPSFVRTLAWSGDSTKLAGALPEGGIGIWNINTGELTSLGIEPPDSNDKSVQQVKWNNQLLAALDSLHRLRVWNTTTSRLVWDSSEHQFHPPVRGIAVNQDGSRVAIGYYSTHEIPVVDGKDGTLQQTLTSPTLLYSISEMAWSPSGNQLAVSAENLFLWSLGENSPGLSLQVEAVDRFSWSPTGVLAVTSNSHRPNELRLINGKSGDLLSSHEIPGIEFPLWSSDGRYIATYRHNPPSDDLSKPSIQIDIWQQQPSLTTTITFPAGEVPSESFVWLPDSSGILGYTASGAFWKWVVGKHEAEIIAPSPTLDMQNQPFLLSVNPQGHFLAVSTLATNWAIQVLDVTEGKILATLPEVGVGPIFFSWGANDTLFIYDGVLHAYRIG